MTEHINISKSQEPMLQVMCITFGTLKIAQNYSCLLCLYAYITMGSHDYGVFYFDICMTLLMQWVVVVTIVGLELTCATRLPKN